VYVAGQSGNAWGSPVRGHEDNYDAFAAMLNSSGALQWNTFLGGDGSDNGNTIAVSGGSVYVQGKSAATWQGASDPERAYSGGDDVFATELDGSGALQWNTFLGSGSADEGHGIAVDGSGNVYVAGTSYATWQGDSEPVRPYDAEYDAFAAKLNSAGALQWNTFLGGDGHDFGYAISVGAGDSAHVAGVSWAAWGTPLRPFDVATDAFVVKLGGDGSLPSDVSIDIDLETGWNMVSVPLRLDPDADAPGDVFTGSVAVYTWDPTLKSYFTPLEIVPEVGYWVAMTAADTITVTGMPVTEWTDALAIGWNMCGSVHGASVAVGDLRDDPSSAVLDSAVYWWNPSSKSYNVATQIEEGKGYWVAATQACDLTVAATA